MKYSFIPSKVYDVLKWVALIVIPALGSFMDLLTITWALEHGAQISATIGGLGTLLGACLLVDNIKYNANINEDPDNGIDEDEELMFDE